MYYKYKYFLCTCMWSSCYNTIIKSFRVIHGHPLLLFWISCASKTFLGILFLDILFTCLYYFNWVFSNCSITDFCLNLPLFIRVLPATHFRYFISPAVFYSVDCHRLAFNPIRKSRFTILVFVSISFLPITDYKYIYLLHLLLLLISW